MRPRNVDDLIEYDKEKVAEFRRLRDECHLDPIFEIPEKYPEINEAYEKYTRDLDALLDEFEIEEDTEGIPDMERDPEYENYESCDPEPEWEN